MEINPDNESANRQAGPFSTEEEKDYWENGPKGPFDSHTHMKSEWNDWALMRGEEPPYPELYDND